MHKYKRLTRDELREMQKRTKLMPAYLKDMFHSLFTHILGDLREIEYLNAQILELKAPDVFKTVPMDLRAEPRKSTGSPFTDNKKLFQAYRNSLDPNSVEFQRVEYWNKRIDSAQHVPYNDTHEDDNAT